MIAISPDTSESLASEVVLANSVSYLWRKLAASPTVGYLKSESRPELVNALTQLLSKKRMTEAEQTNAYIILVALLLANPSLVGSLADTPGLDKLFWGQKLVQFVGNRGGNNVTEVTMSGSLSPILTEMPANRAEATSTSTPIIMTWSKDG